MTKKIKILIVDDLELDRENLRLQLQMIDNVELIGEANNIDDARNIIFKERPDIIFLDIKLPQKNGFELLDELKKLPEIKFDIIFVTAYPEFAFKAFKYFPFHFLEKPVDRQELSEIIKKHREKGNGLDFSGRVDEFNEKARKLHFITEEGHLWIEPKDILWCKANRNYTEIYLKGNDIISVSDNISTIEEKINQASFFRAHRSYLVNINEIKKITKRNSKIELFNNPFKESPKVAKININKLVQIVGVH